MKTTYSSPRISVVELHTEGALLSISDDLVTNDEQADEGQFTNKQGIGGGLWDKSK
jgi:hypothetical protein